MSANLELTRSVWRRNGGILRELALEGFAEAGCVDTMAVPALTPGQAYTMLYDGGIGLVTSQQVRDLNWTMRFELPLIVNRWEYAADPRQGYARLAFRWQVSLAPSF